MSFEVLQGLFLWYFKCYWVFLLMDHRCWCEFCVVLFGCGVSLHMLWVHLCDFNVVVVFSVYGTLHGFYVFSTL